MILQVRIACTKFLNVSGESRNFQDRWLVLFGVAVASSRSSVNSCGAARKTPHEKQKKRAVPGNFDFLSYRNAFFFLPFAQNCYTRNTNKCHKLGINDNGIPVQSFSFISAKIDLTTPPSPLATQHTVPSEIRYN